MANKDFLLFQYRDWKLNWEQLNRELQDPAVNPRVKLLELERAGQYVKRYKKQLRDEHGIEA